MPREPRITSRTHPDEVSRIVDLTWRRIVDLAENHNEAVTQISDSSTVSTASSGAPSRVPGNRSAIYERERLMNHCLESIFGMVSYEQGYLAFLVSVTSKLQYNSPIEMAFLVHLIEKSPLPARATLNEISTSIINRVNKAPNKVRRMLSILAARRNIECAPSKHEVRQVELKRNAAILWSTLAERYAGEMCLSFWNDEVREMLIDNVASTEADVSLRLFSLVALEKFSLTGAIKDNIISNSNIREILLKVSKDCSEFSRITKRDNSNSGDIPIDRDLREEWALYHQLSLCARWALDRTFFTADTGPSYWNLSRTSVIMNPFDSTSKMKVGYNGLEIRNDRSTFESSRASACVKRGKWYYETLVLSSGIIQIGWATSNCKLLPEEGAGVGDDRNGFAFDTYRTAIRANGRAMYPLQDSKRLCHPGDVIGSLLDLDNGSCTFFVNGVDFGITVNFENPRAQKKKAQECHDTKGVDEEAGVEEAEKAEKEEEEEAEEEKAEKKKAEEKKAEEEQAEAEQAEEVQAEEEKAKDPVDPPCNSGDSTDQASKKTSKALGLYPTISMTTGQHVVLNFGDYRWFYPPSTDEDFQGVREAGFLDDAFVRNLARWIDKRGVISAGQGYTPLKKQPLRPLYGADGESRPSSFVSSCYEDEEDEEDKEESEDELDDRLLCEICWAEPKGVTLMPCGHDGFGSNCAKIMERCPLCRAEVIERK